MDRRDFVRALGAALALPALLPAMRAPTRHAAARRVERIGLQLYSLRDAARVDLERTLADIAAIGYREVELLDSMRNFGMPAARLRQVLDRLHLRAPSTHISTAALDDLPRLVGEAETLGHAYVVVASLPIDRRAVTLDAYRRWADRLNTAGETLRRSGLWLAFHNEQENFVEVEGQVPYDVFVARTDPAHVRLQLDTGNAAMGGRDPLPYMERYADRYWLLHVKDAARLRAEHDAELGTGMVDLRGVLARAGALDERYVYIEQESYPGTPLESVRRDYKYLAGLTF